MVQPQQTLLFEANGTILQIGVYGHGPQAVLAFHGFGLDHTFVEALDPEWLKQHTVYSFDLLFHGKSDWRHGANPMTPAYWAETIVQWLNTQGIKQFGLLSYSLGARFAAILAQAMPERVSWLWFIAPDGQVPDFWYRIATSTRTGRWLLRRTVLKPQVFFTLSAWLLQFNLLAPNLLRFANSQMNTRIKRWRVYRSWVVFRRLFVSPQRMAQLCKAHGLKIHIDAGKYDRVIPPQRVKRWSYLWPNSQVRVLEAGHTNVVQLALQSPPSFT